MRIREMNLVIVNAVLLAIYAIGLMGVPLSVANIPQI